MVTKLNFCTFNKSNKYEIEPIDGKAVIFIQMLSHDTKIETLGRKYLLRAHIHSFLNKKLVYKKLGLQRAKN